MSGKSKRLSRRQFLQNTAATAAATTFLAPFTDKLFAQPRDHKEFDYVVIGSGAGGGPLAVNLVNEGFRVALIEAGSRDTTIESEVPAYHGLATEVPSLSWSFGVRHYDSDEKTKAEAKYRAKLDGILYPRGSTIGGSTAVNAMITLYPDNSDWDHMEQVTEDPSWNGKLMRAYFQKLERCRYRLPFPNRGRHGFGGWLSTEQANIEFLFQDKQIKKMVIAAMEAEGFTDTVQALKKVGSLDPNDWTRIEKRLEGFFNIPKATLNGKRSGVRQLVLDAEKRRPDLLHIFHECLVKQIEFDPDSKPLKAKRVHFLKGQSLYKADTRSNSETRARAVDDFIHVGREVIVAGGTFNSPQILMLSGIGPEETLKKHNITVQKHLPGVGQNLQDRYEIGVVSQAAEDFELLKECSLATPGNDACYNQYVMNPEKHIYSTNGVVIGLIKKSSTQKDDPDLFVFGLPGRFTGYYPGWAKNAFQKNEFTWAVLKGHTANKAGYVTLRSKDPMDTPFINFRYFEDGSDRSGDDLRAMVEGVKIAREINRKGAAHINHEIEPSTKYQTDEELRDYLRKNAWGHHASGTNKMGYDKMSVVDKKFKVHGTSNVRVVDASVFPKIPGLFIVAPIYMIAEKASADIIATAYGRFNP
jgi:choline dehydrogenase